MSKHIMSARRKPNDFCRCVMVGLALSWLTAHGAALSPQRVSVNPVTQASGNQNSDTPSLSADGRYVAFTSAATNLVSGYSNLTATNVYLFDRQMNTLELISVSSDGTSGAQSQCTSPQVSADGRYVSFVSSASNLDTEGASVSASEGLHIRDRQTSRTFPPPHDWIGSSAPTYTADGSYLRLVMNADATRFGVSMGASAVNTELIDASGLLSTLCPAASENARATACDNAVIAADGNSIAFRTAYASLVAGDTNGFVDAFVYNATTRQIVRASVNADGSQGNGDVDTANGFTFAGNFAFSGDGHLLAFNSGNATNLGGANLPTQLLLVKNLSSGDVTVASTAIGDNGAPSSSVFNTYGPQFSDAGDLLVYQSQTSGQQVDVRVRNMTTNQVRSLCRTDSGNAAASGCRNVAISADGHWAAFASASTDIAPYPVAPQFVYQDVYIVDIDAVFDEIFADGFEL